MTTLEGWEGWHLIKTTIFGNRTHWQPAAGGGIAQDLTQSFLLWPPPLPHPFPLPPPTPLHSPACPVWVKECIHYFESIKPYRGLKTHFSSLICNLLSDLCFTVFIYYELQYYSTWFMFYYMLYILVLLLDLWFMTYTLDLCLLLDLLFTTWFMLTTWFMIYTLILIYYLTYDLLLDLCFLIDLGLLLGFWFTTNLFEN